MVPGPSNAESDKNNNSLTQQQISGASTYADILAHAAPGASTDDGSFKKPRYASRKEDRQQKRKVIKGSAQASGPFRGAATTGVIQRDLFVYKVDKSVECSALEQYITSKQITVLALSCVSHKDAKYKSFKLAVPKSDLTKLLNGDMWPQGVCVQKYRFRQRPEND